MDPITIALGLASVAPSIIRWITGDDQSQVAAVADKVVSVARVVTGKEDPAEAAAAVKADPAIQFQFQQLWSAHEIGLYQAETDRMRIVNDTMKAEYASNDGFVRRARPTFLYSICFGWCALFVAVLYTMIVNPAELQFVFDGVSKTTLLFGIALPVVGVHIAARSLEKNSDGPSIAPALASGLNAVLGRKS